MRSVEEQLTKITASAVAPRPVRVAISEAQSLMCAEEVVAQRPLPGFDLAAIDGYAVRSVDVNGAGAIGGPESETPGVPVTPVLPVVAEVMAGLKSPTRLQPKQAVWIEAGAPLPILADAVVPLAYTDGGHAKVKVRKGVRSGEYVRRVGDDVQPGDSAVRPGTVIGAAQVGLLAAVGRERVLVHPRPRVAVLSYGSELIDINRDPANGQVFDVNSYALAAAAGDAGAEVNRTGIAPADPKQLRELVESQLARAEIVVISGPVGGEAMIRVVDELATLGDISLVEVAMQPAGVHGFGLLGPEEIPTFILPSHPVDALIGFEVLVRPMIRIALGKRQSMRRTITARTVTPIQSPEGRKSYLRGQLMRDEQTGEYLVQLIGGSEVNTQLLAGLAEANCLVVIDYSITEVGVGDRVDVLFLAQRG